MNNQNPPDITVLFEDNHCIAVAKPGSVSSTHYDGTTETLDRRVKSYLKTKYGKQGEVFLGIVHRLDKPTSGAMLFARTSKSAARLCKQFREGQIQKVYWAVVEGETHPTSGCFEDWLCNDESTKRVRVSSFNSPGAKNARTDYRVRAAAKGLTWLELRPATGRKHQLRAQLSSRGIPIVGDHRYGSHIAFASGIALYAQKLTFLHPVKKEPINVIAPLPESWRRQFSKLFGDFTE